jgi:hypothetical protein
MTDPQKQRTDLLDALSREARDADARAEAADAAAKKLEAELAALRAQIKTAPPTAAPAPAPAAPALRQPRSAVDFVSNFSLEEQASLKAAHKEKTGRDDYFDSLLRTSFGARVTVATPEVYVPGERPNRPSVPNTTTAPAASGRKR